jgi:hypothetical protein
MEISRRFMPLLTELGGWETDFCYKHVAPNGASALQRRLFNRAFVVLRFQFGTRGLRDRRVLSFREFFNHLFVER